MPFNTLKLNFVRHYGKEVNLTEIGATKQSHITIIYHAMHDPIYRLSYWMT